MKFLIKHLSDQLKSPNNHIITSEMIITIANKIQQVNFLLWLWISWALVKCCSAFSQYSIHQSKLLSTWLSISPFFFIKAANSTNNSCSSSHDLSNYKIALYLAYIPTTAACTLECATYPVIYCYSSNFNFSSASGSLAKASNSSSDLSL